MCPIHRHFRRLTSSSAATQCVVVQSSWLVIWPEDSYNSAQASVQKDLYFLIYFFDYFRSFTTIQQYGFDTCVEYSYLCYSRHVRILSDIVQHSVLFSGFGILLTTSLLVPPSLALIAPRYVNSYTTSIIWSSIFIIVIFIIIIYI